MVGPGRDHASGNEKMASLLPGLKVCGNDSRIGALTDTVQHNQELKVRYTSCSLSWRYVLESLSGCGLTDWSTDCEVFGDSVPYLGTHLLLRDLS